MSILTAGWSGDVGIRLDRCSEAVKRAKEQSVAASDFYERAITGATFDKLIEETYVLGFTFYYVFL